MEGYLSSHTLCDMDLVSSEESPYFIDIYDMQVALGPINIWSRDRGGGVG